MSSEKRIPTVWTIGHSDSSGGTGIQADIHTFHDFNVYGCNVVTALVAQNSFATGYSVAAERKAVVAQINALDSDLPATVIKLGMMPSQEVMEPIAKYLAEFDGTVIYDFELSNSGQWLLEQLDQLKTLLFPSVDVLVINTQEATSLTDSPLQAAVDVERAARVILDAGPKSVLITGVKSSDGSSRCDYWASNNDSFWVIAPVVDSVHNRGGGGTLSAALSAALAREESMEAAVNVAKAYVARGIRDANCVGSGPGSVAHHGLPEGSDDWPVISREIPRL